MGEYDIKPSSEKQTNRIERTSRTQSGNGPTPSIDLSTVSHFLTQDLNLPKTNLGSREWMVDTLELVLKNGETLSQKSRYFTFNILIKEVLQ